MTFNADKYIEGVKKLKPYPDILSEEALEKERVEFIERHGSKVSDVQKQENLK